MSIKRQLQVLNDAKVCLDKMQKHVPPSIEGKSTFILFWISSDYDWYFRIAYLGRNSFTSFLIISWQLIQYYQTIFPLYWNITLNTNTYCVIIKHSLGTVSNSYPLCKVHSKLHKNVQIAVAYIELCCAKVQFGQTSFLGLGLHVKPCVDEINYLSHMPGYQQSFGQNR